MALHVSRDVGVGVQRETGLGVILLPSSTAQLLRDRKESALTEWVFPDLLKPESPTRPESAYRQLKKLLARRPVVSSV